MKKNKILFIILFFLTLNLVAQKQSHNETILFTKYLNHLKNFEYYKSANLAKNLPPELQSGANLLSKVLEDAGQSKLKISLDKNLGNSLAACLKKMAFAYNNLYTNPYDPESFKLFNEVYSYSKKIGNKSLEKFSLISILEVYSFEMYQTNDDVYQYTESFRRIKSDNSDEYHYLMNLIRHSLNNIFRELTIDDSFFNQFDQLMKTFPVSHKFWPNYLSSKGVFQETQNKLENAEKSHKRAIKLIGDENFLKFIKFRSYIRLSEIKKKLGQSRITIRYIDSASIHKDLSDSIRSNYYLSYYYSGAFANIGDYKRAYSSIRQSDSLKVFLEYEKNTKEISQLNVKYQTAEKEKQILIEKQRAITNRNWLLAAAMALVLGSIVAILLQKNTSKKHKLAKQTVQLKQQKVESLLKEQELVSIDAMIEGQEKERQKVANELHDDLGSLMATVKLHFDNVKVDEKDPALKNAQKLLDEAYQKIRGMAHAKNSGVMADQGLLPAVKKMVRNINKTNVLKIEVEDFGLAERLENSIELTIFRIIQELIANIIKHSGANKASIQFTQHEDKLNIIVEDNGKGFDISTVKGASDRMGIGTIEKRIEHLEGSFTVDSIIGKGTSILIDIPV